MSGAHNGIESGVVSLRGRPRFPFTGRKEQAT